MILKTLSLTNFKNISNACLEFSPKINCFLGNNGMGKSNLLDAIHYLSITKSYGRLPDSMLIKKDEDFAILNGKYLRHGADEEINVGLRRGARKSFRRGGKEYKRLSEHIGLFPAVMVAPADHNLITGPSEERRRFIDVIISQTDAPYLDALMRYNQALEQRNRMLRDEMTDSILFSAIESVMDEAAGFITRRRDEHIEKLSDIFKRHYHRIAGSDEKVVLEYDKSGKDYKSLAEALQAATRRDRILKYTSVGPHRDDIVFTLDSMPVKQTASQGQTKTFTVSLRFAQYDFLANSIGRKPLLLLDDIFDKLDSRRVEKIVEMVSSEDFGQIFITDTNRKHLDEIMSSTGDDYRMWSVDDGVFTLSTDETH